jgi:ZIP family zinc transporter
MIDWFLGLSPVIQATLAGVFTWVMTALGSSLVFLFHEVNEKLLAIMNGFAAGVMVAASYWSLLAPSIDYAEQSGYGFWSFVPAVVGFLLGGVFLRVIDGVVPHLHRRSEGKEETEGVPSTLSSTTLLFLAVTIHNIPEGLAIGVAFGAAGEGAAPMASAIALALGIGLQNFPEGAALSMPIRADGSTKAHAFNMGQLSAVVEIGAALIGALLVSQMTLILPYALAFAAGAMIFVCVEELVPNSQNNGYSEVATMAFMIGFAIMMTLDVALG